MNPWEVIKELESDNSRLAKEAIVLREAQAGNDEFFKGARQALDSMVTFGIKQVPEAVKDGPGLNPDTFYKFLEQFASRRSTGNEAISHINFLRMKATVDQWNSWYRRILIKDLRCGVTEKTINNVVEKEYTDYSIPVFSCQLAHDGANHEKKIAGTKMVEVKLDGVRVITIVYPDGTVNQYSRNGKELHNFEHIKKQFSLSSKLLNQPTVFDGEVMSANFQDLMKEIHRKENAKTEDAVLHLFDILTLAEFKAGKSEHRQFERSQTLHNWHKHLADMSPNIVVCGFATINLDSEDGKEAFADINKLAIDEGYEGIMIKDPMATYETKRTHSWLKQKPHIEVTLEVQDIEEGTGRNIGRLGALVCTGVDDGKKIQVNVGSGISDIDRELFWNNRTDVIGQLVEVRADAVTQNQDGTYSLRFPRFKTFRGFKPGEKI
jgi:DNA ligase-1